MARPAPAAGRDVAQRLGPAAIPVPTARADVLAALAAIGVPFRVTRAAVALALGRSEKEITRMIADGRLPPHQVEGRLNYWWSDDVRDFMARLRARDAGSDPANR